MRNFGYVRQKNDKKLIILFESTGKLKFAFSIFYFLRLKFCRLN